MQTVEREVAAGTIPADSFVATYVGYWRARDLALASIPPILHRPAMAAIWLIVRWRAFRRRWAK